MLAYNMRVAEPAGLCRTAALMKFQDGLIVRNELFFDASPFKKTWKGACQLSSLGSSHPRAHSPTRSMS